MHNIASRAVCVRFCMELWANSKQAEDLHNKLKTYPISEIKKWTIIHNRDSVGNVISFV